MKCTDKQGVNNLLKLFSHLLDPEIEKNHSVYKKKNLIFYSPKDRCSETIALEGLFSDENLKDLSTLDLESQLDRYENLMSQYFLLKPDYFNLGHKAYNSAAYYCTQNQNAERIEKLRQHIDLSSETFQYNFSFLTVNDLDELKESKIKVKTPFDLCAVIVIKGRSTELYCWRPAEAFSKTNLIQSEYPSRR